MSDSQAKPTDAAAPDIDPEFGTETLDAVDVALQAEADASAADADAAPAEPTPEERIATLERQFAEARDMALRKAAEFDNYRRRMQREFTEERTKAKINTIAEFLPALDNFSLAMDTIEKANDIVSLKQGMAMIAATFARTFESLGVTPIEALGAPLDPHLHAAISTEASDTVPEDHIVRVFQHGYRLGDKVIRHATVVVSSGPEAPADETPADADTDAAADAETDA